MINAKEIGERLTNLRVKANKSRVEVAIACKITRSAISMYETGQRVPKDDIKIRLAKYYNESIEKIFYL